MLLATQLQNILAVTIILYVAFMFYLGYLANKRIENVDDYVVAGRNLPFWLASATLLATWFGAGVLLTATDEVRKKGLTGATLDPLGAGICLVLVGLFFANPLWQMKLRTLPDFFRTRFDPRAEFASSILMIPPYLGWIAAQFMALGGMLHLFFGISLSLAMLMVAAVGIGYTLVGGMWAVALTDAVQLLFIVIGLLIMSFVILHTVGSGDVGAGWQRILNQTDPDLGALVFSELNQWQHILERTDPKRLQLIPGDTAKDFAVWLGVLCAGALGNIPSQDVMQRVFSSRSAQIARRACIFSGVLYLILGVVPILMGLASPFLLPPGSKATSTIAMLTQLFLHPVLAVVLVVTIMSAVLSTIDSAILAPATVLAQNLLKRSRWLQHADELQLNRISVLIIGLASVGVAFAGENAYSLLESGYELGMVSLMTPLALGLWLKRRSNLGILAAMFGSTTIWLVHKIYKVESFFNITAFPAPVGLMCMVASFVIYFLVASFLSNQPEDQHPAPETT